MANGDFKHSLSFKSKAFNIAKDVKYDGYQRGLASMFYKFFDKKKLQAVVLNLCKKKKKMKN